MGDRSDAPFVDAQACAGLCRARLLGVHGQFENGQQAGTVVLEKRPFYRSKKYDNAPMPWMERIDNYGIAFHGGVNPGYPASHGCMRLPMKFAEKLYSVTKIGTRVVIEG